MYKYFLIYIKFYVENLKVSMLFIFGHTFGIKRLKVSFLTLLQQFQNNYFSFLVPKVRRRLTRSRPKDSRGQPIKTCPIVAVFVSITLTLFCAGPSPLIGIE